ncbi:hypothetical protein CEW92_06765 [Bacillaceae bacterium SAS-127]|nr:hypothetical protein CEW92_06765 [Bacillaceae bacterium SAS-127]
MIRVMIRVKDKNKIDSLKAYGVIVFKSPILNLVTLEIKEANIERVKNDQNVISCELDLEGQLMPV